MLGVSVASAVDGQNLLSVRLSCGLAEPVVCPTQLCKTVATVGSKEGRVGLCTSPKLPEGSGSLPSMPAKLVGLHGSWGVPAPGISQIFDKGVK